MYLKYVLICSHTHSTLRGRKRKEKKEQSNVRACMRIYTHSNTQSRFLFRNIYLSLKKTPKRHEVNRIPLQLKQSSLQEKLETEMT